MPIFWSLIETALATPWFEATSLVSNLAVSTQIGIVSIDMLCHLVHN